MVLQKKNKKQTSYYSHVFLDYHSLEKHPTERKYFWRKQDQEQENLDSSPWCVHERKSCNPVMLLHEHLQKSMKNQLNSCLLFRFMHENPIGFQIFAKNSTSFVSSEAFSFDFANPPFRFASLTIAP